MELKSTSSASGLDSGSGSSPAETDEEAGVVIVVSDEKPKMSGALSDKKETNVGGDISMPSSSSKDEDLPGITLTKAP